MSLFTFKWPSWWTEHHAGGCGGNLRLFPQSSAMNTVYLEPILMGWSLASGQSAASWTSCYRVRIWRGCRTRESRGLVCAGRWSVTCVLGKKWPAHLQERTEAGEIRRRQWGVPPGDAWKGEAGRIVLKGRERPDFCLRNPCVDGGLGGRPSSLMNSLKRDVSWLAKLGTAECGKWTRKGI